MTVELAIERRLRSASKRDPAYQPDCHFFQELTAPRLGVTIGRRNTLVDSTIASGAAVSLLTAMAFNPAAVSFRAKGWPPPPSRRQTGVPAFALISLTSFAAISLAATFGAAPSFRVGDGVRQRSSRCAAARTIAS